MRRCWVVLLEVQAHVELERETVEAVLAELADHYPSVLWASERCAVQFLVEDADGPAAALTEGVAVLRRALHAVGFPADDIVRAEVKTPAELVAEFDAEEMAADVHVPADQRAQAAAYEATRKLVRSRSRREAVSVLLSLVRQLGGTPVRPREGDPRILDYDLSLGVGEPMVVAADPYSIDRLCLEEVLPAVVEDAERVARLVQSSWGGDVLADVADVDRF